MQFWTDARDVPSDFGPSAVTVGKFDGLHAGHRAVIATLLSIAAERELVPAVVTFDRNPLSVIRPELCPDPLVSNSQKAELLAQAGVEATLMVTFDEEFRTMSAEAFVSEILVKALRARVVLVGGDFRFGSRGSGDVALLTRLGAELGFEVVVIDDVVPDGTRRVSSTWVRELLAQGDVKGAAALLGTLPSVRATVVHGAHRGRELGYPTANLATEREGFTPADGVYAAWLTVRGVRYPAAVSIGNNPTFEGVPEKQVEAHALDQDFDIYGETVTLEFVEHIRGMVKYTTVEALIDQIARDEEIAREILGIAPRTPS
ncbi:riboflavin kinase/FMN adenylyltransferase [Microbacteriaceae bacterium SG_E_30_P1]|uniref:Riboflavin biosynthesis protein n=1 Tax=Antiquaquibacter oligotrophicus TaxID=2880260 RepID=A0ABT6KN73_9MICO|nr:bifunctional riboflavin kinase/FAD synthetase [Antiquaquibacter oligotrophicus]MDH6180609.1 riboflavin kinase/FMN adenylyltransferase [Antiquaquibacter oligotrophicus]UDF13658.1 bifunctional riboflavin kinase/FAD synthetase [Antiquaquibacter oligotrophicus]